MAWPSSRPRDSSPRIICGEPSFYMATMTKSFSILSFCRLFQLQAGNTSRIRAVRARARVLSRARVCSACRFGAGFPGDAREGETKTLIVVAFRVFNASICVYLMHPEGGPLESCAAFLMFVLGSRTDTQPPVRQCCS